MLERCRGKNITISQKKIELSNRIKFAGHTIPDKGYGPDNEDDTLVWAETEMELLDKARIVLERCKVNDITISLKARAEQHNKIPRAYHLGRGLWARQRKICGDSTVPEAQKLQDL